MELFVDIAKLEEIKKCVEIGFTGCTTNPSILKEAIDELKSIGENINLEEYVSKICGVVGKDNHVSLEVVHTDKDEAIIKEARILHEKFNSVSNNVVIKVPISMEGLKATKVLSEESVRINMTLVFTPSQAILASKCGADFVSPFCGRIDDYIRSKFGIEFKTGDYFPAEGITKNGVKYSDNGVCSGVDLVRKITNIYRIHKIKTKVIAASIRNTRQLMEILETGADIITIPFNVVENMTEHFKTTEGINKFFQDSVPEYKILFG